MRKLLLVSHDLNCWDLSGYTQQVSRTAEKEGCTDIIYSLFTVHTGHSQWKLNFKDVFASTTTIQKVYLEAGNFSQNRHCEVQVWERDRAKPKVFTRYFATSLESEEKKDALIKDLNRRCLDEDLLLICGELNVIKYDRSKNSFKDTHYFIKKLNMLEPKLIIGQTHTYMRRPEMSWKRKYLSRNDRYFVSVWCKDKNVGREPNLPWQVCFNGEDITEEVHEITHNIKDRPDIRMGILTIS